MTYLFAPGALYKLKSDSAYPDSGWWLTNQNQLYSTFGDYTCRLTSKIVIMCLEEKFIQAQYQYCPTFLLHNRIIYIVNTEKQIEKFVNDWKKL